jgi:hypothetical protein
VRSTWFSATALPVCAAEPTTTVEPQPQWLPWLTASSRLTRASQWPHTRKILAETMLHVPDDEARRMVEDNARTFYNFPRC